MKHTPTLFALLAAAGSLHAAEWQFGGNAALGYNSIYEFRGVDLGSDMIEASAGLTATYGDLTLSASVWYATVNDNPINQTPDELDYTLAFSKPLGPVTLTGGYIYYEFNNAGHTNTQELYLGASATLVAGITGSITAYRDVDLLNGWYVDTNLSRTFALSSCLDLTLTAGCGYADNHGWQLQKTGTLDGFQQWYLSASLPWKFREGFNLTPYVKYVDADSDLISDLPGNGTGDNHLIYGVKLGFTF